MAYIADHLFPPIQADDWCGYDEYSNFNFWRDPVPEIQMEVGAAGTPKEGSPNSKKQKQQQQPQQQTNDMAVTGRSSTGGNNNSQLSTIPEK